MVGGRSQPECREHGGRSGIGVGCWRYSLEAGDPVFLPPPQRVLASPHGLTHRCKGPRVVIIFQRRLESGFGIQQCEVAGRSM